MPHDDCDLLRRTLLLSGAALAVPRLALAAPPAAPPTASAPPLPGDGPAGRPGDFAFLTGTWRIHNRRRKGPGAEAWDEFPGEATCWSLLAGAASVEELRIPARDFSGMGLRLLDRERRVWSDFWVNARSGVLAPPGLTGGFRDGAGIFTAEDQDGEVKVLVRSVWDRITPTSCRWHQAASRDGGKSWVEDWLMDWSRVGAAP